MCVCVRCVFGLLCVVCHVNVHCKCALYMRCLFAFEGYLSSVHVVCVLFVVCVSYMGILLCVWYVCMCSSQHMCGMYLLYICGIFVVLMWFTW